VADFIEQAVTMPYGTQFEFNAGQFSGIVRLFPLPNLVLFPGALQPLHIFEPRYCDLMAETVATDGLIAMAVLAPGWESDYEGRPPIYPVACLGRVTTYHRLDDGRYNLLLLGVARTRILEELPPSKSFREARSARLEEKQPNDSVRQRLTKELLAAFEGLMSDSAQSHEQLRRLAEGQATLESLTDLVAFASEMSLDAKVSLLAEPDVEARAHAVLAWLSSSAPRGGPGFPPPFSEN
jgi:Lon protease-like protein